MSLILLKPTCAAEGYAEAAAVFARMYQQVTGRELPVAEDDDGISDLIVIGSDAVNDFAMREVLELRLGSLGIRYGTDDYCIRSHTAGGRRALLLAGGRVRSTLYAVYDYFERFAGCHYFWDGDVIPSRKELPLEGIAIVERPRFDYRGLRYFAHRGLKRFQAEHWNFADWKQELDWMVKKRLNFFMLRIGMDDVWQRAFPDEVPYPEDYRTITGADAISYDDRSDFWTLKHRGELREQIMAYARLLDLTTPVDCGTMTHWYSRTPLEFLENARPDFITQEIAHYTASDTGRVFDFTRQRNMDYYMHLTETMVENYEKSDGLFHTIGLGERQMYRDPNKNFALKLIAYRRIAENIRRRYPDSKLMLASWDFIGWWTPEQVQALMEELDPERTIILDYTSETDDPDVAFPNWGVMGKIPWIFGLFHAYESECELRGPYDRSDERLRLATEDPFCKGMILWPELSHSDPLVLEYLSANAWHPLEKSIEELTESFCHNRYGNFADHMNGIWQTLLPFIKQGDWGGYSRRKPGDENYAEYSSNWYTHADLWPKPTIFLDSGAANDDNLYANYALRLQRMLPLLDDVFTALKKLSLRPEALQNAFILRDALDLTRTVLGRVLSFALVSALAAAGSRERIEVLEARYLAALSAMTQLLSLHTDYSMYHTLRGLEAAAPTNPNFEITLKRNFMNQYCVQAAYEPASTVFTPEAQAVFDWLKQPDASLDTRPDFTAVRDRLYGEFFTVPLASMQPDLIPAPEKAIADAVDAAAALAELLG